jgi:tetratricopeptide (TPR) repeat protein
MQRRYAVRPVAVALALALVAPWVAIEGGAVGIARAQEGGGGSGTPAAPSEYRGRVTDFDAKDGTLRLDPGGRFVIAESARLGVELRFQHGLAKVGKWAAIKVNAQQQVTDAIEIEDPTGGSAGDSGHAARDPALAAKFNSLPPHARVRITYSSRTGRGALETIEGIFEKLEKGVVFVTVPGAERQPLIFFDDVRSLEHLQESSTGPSAADERIKPGDWVRVALKTGETLTGLCTRHTADVLAIDVWPSMASRTFPWSQVDAVTKEKRPELPGATTGGTAGGTVGAPKLATDELLIRLSPRDDARDLDWAANEWRMPAVVSHDLAGKIVIGARVEMIVQGSGVYVRPAKEAEMLRVPNLIGKETENSFNLEGLTYFFKREGESLLVAELDERARQAITEPLHVAILPGIPEEIEIRTRIFDPKVIDGPRVKYDRERGVIAIGDERALPVLLKAYADNKRVEAKPTILRALKESANPKVLPFLLYELYLEAEPSSEGSKRLRETIAGMGPVAETYLVELLRDELYKKKFPVPAAGGGVEEKAVPSDPEKLLARAIELLGEIAVDRPSEASRLVLPFARHKNEVLRDAARSFFLSRGASATTLEALVRRLTPPTAAEAKDLLRELGRREPGAITQYMSQSMKIDTSELQRATQGLLADEVADKEVEFLVEALRKDPTRGLADENVTRARDVLQRIQSARTEVTSLRKAISVDYSKRALDLGGASGDPEARPKKIRLLERAVLLDPDNRSARSELAATHLEIAAEVRRGALALRSGPGDHTGVLKELQAGEGLLPMSAPEDLPPEVAAAWRFAKTEQTHIGGWVHAAYVSENKAKTLLLVQAGKRPAEDWVKHVRLARAISPDRNDRIERALADGTAQLASEAGEGGNWKEAYRLYRMAASLSPVYRGDYLKAYLRSEPLVPISIVAALIAFFAVALTGAGAPKAGRVAPVAVLKKKDPIPEPAAGAGTKKVPS